MSKIPVSQETKLTDASAVETDPDILVGRAATWAMKLWNVVHRGMGDTQEAAMHRAAKLANVSPNTIWKLRYRRPRSVDAHIYFRLQAAYQQHVESAEATVAANLEILRTLPATPRRDRLVAQMAEFLRDQEGEEGGVAAPFAAEDEDQSRHWG